MAEKVSETHQTFVLDTSALFAYLDDEIGADKVERLLKKAKKEEIKLIIPWTCIGEVYYITQQRQGMEKALQVVSVIKTFPATFAFLDSEEEFLIAGNFKTRYSISLADSYVAGVALNNQAKVVTKDPEFLPLQKGGHLKILWISKIKEG